MDFRNDPVDPDTLPTYEAVTLNPVSPRFPFYRVLSHLVFWLPLAAVLWVMPDVGALPAALTDGAAYVIAGAGGVLALLSWFEAERRAYGLREHDLIYRSGLIIQRTTIVPISRIQHVEAASGPLERAFDLMRLVCYTAGGASADLVVQGLPAETAERLRQHLLEKLPDESEGTYHEAE